MSAPTAARTTFRLAAIAMAAGLTLLPTAALLAPGLLGAPEAPGAQPRNLPPVYAPDGLGAFPSEGSLGTHGCPHPVAVADVAAGLVPEGAEVCLETSEVVAADPANRSRLFRVRSPASGAELDVRISQRWWAHGTPAVGMVVVVEGTVAHVGTGGAGADRTPNRDPRGGEGEGAVAAATEWRIEPVARWVDLTHPGIEVDAWKVAAGLVPEGTYVWVDRATVMAVWRNNDGPNDIGDNHVETGTVCPSAHLTTETVPELFGIVSAPPIGATIRLYGATRYDDGHEWWEVHPIRAWQVLPSEDAMEGCPDRLGESGVPPPGIPRCPLEPLPSPVPKPDVCLPRSPSRATQVPEVR